ncbi:hypothetical protein DFH27DRAFT_359508 [Peziza echinospora]|nr:hypothetical protein DFH27DRAFT_359508 [Peziza echinospora]
MRVCYVLFSFLFTYPSSEHHYCSCNTLFSVSILSLPPPHAKISPRHNSSLDSNTNYEGIHLVAYQFNSLRARMVNHLIMQHRGFGPYLTEYLDRIGVLILNSIAVFLDDNSLIQNGLAGNFHNPITKEKYSLQDLLGVAQVRDRNDFSPDGRPAEAQQKPEERLYYEIHDLVYAAAGLSLMMRSDYSLCYMDMGGLNLRWDRAMMEHSGTFFNQTSPMDTWLARSIESQRKNPRRALNAFAFLVVAPAMKRTGSEGGKGYTEVRLLKKTLAYGV